MSEFRQFVIRCDAYAFGPSCDKIFSAPVGPLYNPPAKAVEVRRQAKTAGWTLGGSGARFHDLCPEHVHLTRKAGAK